MIKIDSVLTSHSLPSLFSTPPLLWAKQGRSFPVGYGGKYKTNRFGAVRPPDADVHMRMHSYEPGGHLLERRTGNPSGKDVYECLCI